MRYWSGEVSWNSSTIATGNWSTMRRRSASPFAPSSALFRRASMSAKPNWRLRRFRSIMRRAMLQAAWRSSACAIGSISSSAAFSAAVASKQAGTSASKSLA
jgi:hypothetical protein